jgi:hypothetical protein
MEDRCPTSRLRRRYPTIPPERSEQGTRQRGFTCTRGRRARAGWGSLSTWAGLSTSCTRGLSSRWRSASKPSKPWRRSASAVMPPVDDAAGPGATSQLYVRAAGTLPRNRGAAGGLRDFSSSICGTTVRPWWLNEGFTAPIVMDAVLRVAAEAVSDSESSIEHDVEVRRERGARGQRSIAGFHSSGRLLRPSRRRVQRWVGEAIATRAALEKIQSVMAAQSSSESPNLRR